MFPELDESDGEELPAFHSLIKQPPEEGGVVVLCNSDSEGSSISSPAWKKPRGAQDSTEAAPGRKVVVLLSSESEEEEIIPLVERLKKKLPATQPSVAGTSFTRIQEQRSQDSAGGSKVSSSNEEAAPGGLQPSLPRGPEAQRRAAPGTWELSESDEDLPSWEPTKQALDQPSVCLSDCPVQNVTHQVTQISLKPFPVQTNAKRSQEELEQARQAALQRRKDRDAQKALQEQERERRKVLANRQKAQRPEECLKHIQVVLDPGLLQVEGGGQVLSALQAMECSCVIETQAVPFSITWRRKTGLAQVEGGDLMEEPSILVLVLLEDFVTMIRNSKQVGMEGPVETLQSFVANIMKKAPGKTLALAVVELEKYFSSHKHKSQKKLPQQEQNGSEAQEQGRQRNPRGPKSVRELSRVDVEEAMVDLQLHMGVQVQILESWKEFGDFARMFTKAVAETPFKRERDKTSFSFCLEGDWVTGMKVDRSGKGLLQVWKKQIQQFSRVILEMANAIVAKYPSPLLLMQAYDACSSEQERQNLLAEIPVRRGDGVTASTRRVGPDLSKRIYLQMTSHNPDLSLDVTG
ncbi:structure-specific endonuclease subunit EME1 isoform X1 [Pogona vitticeps]